MLPPHSNDAFNHWFFLSVGPTSSRVPFSTHIGQSILLLEFSAIETDTDRTYALVVHFKTFDDLSRYQPHSDHASGLPPHPQTYAWEDWGPVHTRFLGWEPTGEDGLGSPFGMQYAKGIRTSDGACRLLILDFNPTTPFRHPEQYRQSVKADELLKLAASAQLPHSGCVIDPTTMDGDDLFSEKISTSLPFAFDLAAGEIPSTCVELDFEHVLVTQVRSLHQCRNRGC